MRHPSEGALRRLLDEPDGVAEPDRHHAAACTRCQGVLTAMRSDADLVARSLPGLASADVDAAWSRISSSPTATPRPATARPTRSRAMLRRPAAAVAFMLVLTGAGVAAANDWLPIFRAERVAPVTLSTADLVALPALGEYGVLTVTERPEVEEAAHSAAAEASTGLDVPVVAELPRGVRGEPMVQVASRGVATFTFSTERATRAAAKAGKTLPTPPPGLDGSSVRLQAGPGVAQIWSSAAGVPALVVGRAIAPTAHSTGVPFETLRDYLLALPGLPPHVADQLRVFAAEGSTLPIPVPADRFRTSAAVVDGVDATVLTSRDRTMAGVVWVKDGLVTLVAGSLDDDEVLTVARELR